MLPPNSFGWPTSGALPIRRCFFDGFGGNDGGLKGYNTCLHHNLYTVESIYKGHPWNKAKVITTERWPLQRRVFANESGDASG